MGEITRDYLVNKRAEYIKARDNFDGAIMALDELINLLEQEAPAIGEPEPTEAGSLHRPE